MKLTIKVLKGQDIPLEVTPDTTILQVKQQIETNIKVPPTSQKLLLVGRTLSDENAISFYSNIKDGTKLNLIVMKPDGLKDVIYRSFRKYYNEAQSERLTREFMVDFENKLAQMSLDDIERLADGLSND